MNISDYIQKSNKINSKGCKHNVKIAYLSNITIAGLPEVMNVFCHRDSIFSEFYSAPYNQYAQDIISESSNLYSFEPNIIFIVLDYQSFFGDLFWTPYSFSSELRESIISEKFEEINNLLNTLKSRTNAKIVVNNSVIPTFSSRGIFESKEPKGVRNLIYDFNKKLSDLFASESQIFVYDFLAFAINEGMKKISNEKLHYLADMRISPQSLINLGCQFMGYIYPLLSLTKKCIVLDLDNTLWGGVIGEEGINNINLGPEKEGQPFLDFQKVLLDYFNRGIILAINSKNNLDDAMDVINNHPHMILREDHFACIKANWNDKATNMSEISSELDIGLESFVFFDDDKTNRDLVKQIHPEIWVVDLPDDISLYPSTLQNLEVFNQFSLTKDDTNRGKSYIGQKKRKMLKTKYVDIKSYLKQLNIKANILNPLDNIPRISQLTQKTNQFNLTTKRYLEENIATFSKSDDFIVNCINVEDKFGEYGVTGVYIIEKHAKEQYWNIDTFLLSCRVLGKDIEFALMNNIINSARQLDVKSINARFIPTQKNKPAEGFLSDCGFEMTDEIEDEKLYSLNVKKAVAKEISVEVSKKYE